MNDPFMYDLNDPDLRIYWTMNKEIWDHESMKLGTQTVEVLKRIN